MKKKIFTSLIFCFFLSAVSFNTLAQEYRYDISKYYTPDIVRNRLDVSFNTNNSFSNSKSIIDTTRLTYSTNMNGMITPDFQTYTNTRSRLSNFQISGQFSDTYYSSGSINDSNPNKDFDSENNLLLNYSNRFYNLKNQFLIAGIASNFQAQINNRNSSYGTNHIKETYHDYSLSITPTIGVGLGRIEQVEDARQAIYILEDLSKKGVLNRKLNDTEIFQFAQQISRVKNKRFLDYRLHLIDEITAVDSFLINNNLLKNSDARYFTSLYDNWQYGALFSRKSGQSVEIKFEPYYNWNYYKVNPLDSTYRRQVNQTIIRGGLSLVYTYEKPKNLNWQHSATVSLNGYTDLSNTINQNGYNVYQMGGNFSLNGYTTKSINLSGTYTLGFYPSTRTNVNIGARQNTSMLYYKELNINSNSWGKSLISSTELYFSAYYYLSQQVRLSVGANIRNNYTNYYPNSDNQLYLNFGGTLSYSLF